MSVCRNEDINLYISANIDKNNLFKYNLSSHYCSSLCFPYTTIYKTDIILRDRREDCINNTSSLCEDNCEFNEYNSIRKLAKCKCKIKINTKNSSESAINKDKLINNFKDFEHISNFYVIKCYKLLFKKEGIKNNIGNYIIALIIIFNIIISILFKIKGYKKFIKRIKEIIKNFHKNKNINNTNKKKINVKKNNKEKNIIIKNNDFNKGNKMIKKTKKSKTSIIKNPLKKLNSHRHRKVNKAKSHKNIINHNNTSIIENILNKNTESNGKINTIIKYNDFELNNLIYEEALKIDKRNYYQYYISLIKSKHDIIFTFFTKNDFNSTIIKISLLLLSFSLYFTINGLFFNDSAIHQILVYEGSFNLNYQIPQVLYSIIISGVLNNIIRYFSLSEKNVLNIKNMEKTRKEEKEEYKCITIKFIIFFILNFILLFLFWFYISCFCAVYYNTQHYLIKDTMISYGLSLIYPFVLNLIPGIFRIIALNSRTNNKNCLYQMSQLIQII